MAGLSETFQSGGLGEIFKSWVSTNENATITPEQIETVLGSSGVGDVAKNLGIDSAQASALIAQALPGVIDKLTPGGQIS